MIDKRIFAMLVALAAGTGVTLAALEVEARGGGHGGAMGGGEGAMLRFEQLDGDSDGKVTAAELAAAKAARFAAIDANSDGEISAEEMQAHATAEMAANMARMARMMIARHDEDANGTVSQAEMDAGGRGGDMMARFDLDEDGAISQAEFAKAMKRSRGRGREGENRREWQRN